MTATNVPPRIQAVVGPRIDAIRWITDQHLPLSAFRIISNPRGVLGLNARKLNLIILPQYWDMPAHIFMRVELRLLERLGATMEWACPAT